MNLQTLRNHFFDDWFRDTNAPGFLIKPLHGDALPTQFKLDIQDKDKSYYVQAELPGVGKDDIEVEVNGDMLTIKAEVKQCDSHQDEGHVVCRERFYGMVSRSVRLPGEVKREQAEARYENGILRLTLPKAGRNGRHCLTIK